MSENSLKQRGAACMHCSSLAPCTAAEYPFAVCDAEKCPGSGSALSTKAAANLLCIRPQVSEARIANFGVFYALRQTKEKHKIYSDVTVALLQESSSTCTALFAPRRCMHWERGNLGCRAVPAPLTAPPPCPSSYSCTFYSSAFSFSCEYSKQLRSWTWRSKTNDALQLYIHIRNRLRRCRTGYSMHSILRYNILDRRMNTSDHSRRTCSKCRWNLAFGGTSWSGPRDRSSLSNSCRWSQQGRSG